MIDTEIGSVVESIETWDPRNDATHPFTYLDLSSVDQEAKRVDGTKTLDPNDAPSRARQLTRTGDVLVSTVRPNLNAVAVVPSALDGATVSTGFCVLRPRHDLADSRYLWHWVRSPVFVGRMTQLATGASYPAVSDKIIKASTIPLPPIREQRRIAAVLDAADALRVKRRQALAKFDTLTQSIFIGMFADSLHCRQRPLGEFFAEKAIFGTMEPGMSSGSWLDLRVANIQNGRLDLSDRKFVELRGQDRGRYAVRDGDLLLARAIATIDHLGKCIVAHPESDAWAFDSHLMRIRLHEERMVPEFLAAWLASPTGRRAFLRVARRSSVQFNVNTKEMSRLPVPAVDIRLQREFKEVVKSVEAHRELRLSSANELDTLFASVQQRAFQGEL